MSLPTVMRIVEDLIKEDLIRFAGSSEPSGGRRRPLLEFKGGAYSVAGVDMGGTELVGMMADLSGNIQHEIRVPLPTTESTPLDELYDLITALLAAPRPAGQRVRGIGVGAPGVTISEAGIVTWAPSFNWRDLPLKRLLAERFDLPVFVENDVNLAALGELEFGSGVGARNLVCLTLGTGVGAGIVIGGGLYRGHNQAAGEAGYILPSVDFLGKSYADFGALESLASSSGIIKRAREHLASSQAANSDEITTVESIFAAAETGADWAQATVEELVNYLCLAIANISALLDPERIILGGELSNAADTLINTMNQKLETLVPYTPELIASSLGRQAVVMGAIMLVLNNTTDYVVVRDMGSG